MTVGGAGRIALVCALVLAACQTRDHRSAPLPGGPQVVDVEMTEYSFNYDTAISAGRVLFRVTNTGREAHSLAMIPLSDDIPPIDQQVRGSQRLAVRPFAGVTARDSGESTTFAVDLVPGVRYALLCFVTDSDRVSHLLRGMTSEFRVAKIQAETPVSSSPSSARPSVLPGAPAPGREGPKG